MDTNLLMGIIVLTVLLLLIFYMLFMSDDYMNEGVSTEEEKIRIENERRWQYIIIDIHFI